MERVVNSLCQVAADALHPGEVLCAGRRDALHAAELAQQLPPALRAQPGMPSSGLTRRVRRAAAGARDRKPVSLVADLLDQVQGA
jgi:hypothetical protein